MYDVKGNEDHICILDNLLDHRQTHLHMHLKEKNEYYSIAINNLLFSERKLIKNSRIRSLTCFKHQTNINVVPLLWKSAL